jgi:hypothetical protein
MVDSFSSDPDMAVGELRPPYRYDVGTEFLAKRGQGEGCVTTVKQNLDGSPGSIS